MMVRCSHNDERRRTPIANYNLDEMHIVIADSLPPSAADAFRTLGWTVDAKSGRSPDELARDLSECGRADRSKRHAGHP